MVLEFMSLKPFSIYLQYALPKQAITALAGRLANARLGWLTQRFIAWFIKRYQVDMHEAAHSDIASYASFNAFFTRPLKAGLRRQARAQLVAGYLQKQGGHFKGHTPDRIFLQQGQ